MTVALKVQQSISEEDPLRKYYQKVIKKGYQKR